MPQQELLYGIYAEVREGRAELRAHRENSEDRDKGLHRRIDRLEDKTDARFAEINSKMERVRREATSVSSTRWLEIAGLLVKPLTFVASHWQAIAWMMLTVLGFFGVQSPETIKALLGK